MEQYSGGGFVGRNCYYDEIIISGLYFGLDVLLAVCWLGYGLVDCGSPQLSLLMLMCGWFDFCSGFFSLLCKCEWKIK